MKDLMFEVYTEDDEEEGTVSEVSRYYANGMAEVASTHDEDDHMFFVWRLKDGLVQYWLPENDDWKDDCEEVQHEYQQWLNRQITE